MNKNVRIVLVVPFPLPYPGAAWVRTNFFAEFLKGHGCKVHILGAFSFKTIKKLGLVNWNGIKIFNIIPVIMTSNLFSIIFNTLSSFLVSIPVLVISKCDVVLISVPPGEASIGTFIIAKMLNKKVIFDYRDEWEDHAIELSQSRFYKKYYGFLKKIMNLCYNKSDAMITVTNSLAKNLMSRRIEHVQVITNGADCSAFMPLDSGDETRRELGLHENDFVLVFTGQLTEYYDIDLVLKAIQKISFKCGRLKFLIIAYGNSFDQLTTLSKELGLKDQVIFIEPKQNTNDLVKIISCCDAGIVPLDASTIRSNTLPVKCFEFFACGLPVIATTKSESELADLIVSYDLGLISEPGDINKLADNICLMYNSDIQSMGLRAIALVKKKYDRNILSQELFNTIKRLAHRT